MSIRIFVPDYALCICVYACGPCQPLPQLLQPETSLYHFVLERILESYENEAVPARCSGARGVPGATDSFQAAVDEPMKLQLLRALQS